MRRVSLLAVICGALFVTSMWLAEGSRFPLKLLANPAILPGAMIVVIALATVVVVAILAAAVLRPHRWWWQVAGAALLLVGLAGGVAAGDYCQARAFNECIARSTILQESLRQFKAHHGRYPTLLSEIGAVPCRRCLRGSIIQYSSNGSSYTIGFRDWLVSWRGTEREAITATK